MAVLEANSKMVQERLEEDQPLLLEFYATWCPHCKRMAPTYEDVAERLEGEVDVWRIDGDESIELATDLNVEGFPTFILFESGKPVRKTAGEMTADTLLAELELLPSNV